MTDKLDQETAYSKIRAIFDKKVLVVVGTGASMAVDQRFGMTALSEELSRKIPSVATLHKELEDQWNSIKERINNIGLEKALDSINNEELISTIIKVTGGFVARIDAENKKKSLLNDFSGFPIEKFMLKLVNSLSYLNPALNVITSNYDLLIEHICDRNNIPYCTGFQGGITKYYNWKVAEKKMCYTKYITKGNKRKKVERTKKHIKLHKVHGSINWFWHENQIVEDNSLTYDKECCLKRAIITPGDTKISEAFMKYRDFFNRADNAVANDDAYIFVGYGFNDVHIEKETDRHLKTNNKPGIIITQKLSNKAEDLVKTAKNLWAVYQDPDNNSNTRIKNKKYANHLTLKNSGLWKINEFTDTILGV